jgi:hypothetical protein
MSNNPVVGFTRLSLAVFVGGGAIYAILWLIGRYTDVGGANILELFAPLGLLWVVICIGLALWHRSKIRKGVQSRDQ